ncbi:hypothetical protein [Proteus mirabilis]|uniref:hypothetical protein n=1 Tax=Proteus mirabilis TaxID=584 RepID=UPI000D579DEA|nr:hypothetical protein [Proteus mirabilis]EKV9967308.1 hypothetical protein [Proteus mirabilis]ELA7948723.1 hypothetical protein [Proteus mirabilis]MBG2994244.1 hypothetical protein [Proteus mirabilis]MBG3001893.1 hypothetical protein [Proteus mirabilis]MBI6330204.1 hypothetical protein [Proteus mirabilis]
MMTINPTQWRIIEEKLKSDFVHIEFQYKDHKINVVRSSIKEGKTALLVYLNGKIKAEWCRSEDEYIEPLVKLFWHQRHKSLYPPQIVKELEKMWGKRRVQREYKNLNEKITYYSPYFNKASVLVRQFKRIEGISVKQNEWITLQG